MENKMNFNQIDFIYAFKFIKSYNKMKNKSVSCLINNILGKFYHSNVNRMKQHKLNIYSY